MQLLTLAAFIFHLALVARPAASFLSRPFQEDAFYSLSVAKSLGQGEGVTIDGVHPTNGVQPLICFLDAPLFALSGGDRTLALRLVLLLQVVIYAAAAFAIAWFATTLLRVAEWRRELYWLTAMIVAWSYSLVNGMMNGLETGLAAALIFASAAYYNTRIAGGTTGFGGWEEGRPSLGRFAVLGLLLGVAVLARIDITFFVASLLLWHLVRAHLRYGRLPIAQRMAGLRRVIVECCVVGLVSIAVSSPWWIYNVVTFGSLLPISGQAQRLLIPDRRLNIEALVTTISNSFPVFLHSPQEYSFHSPLIGFGAFVAVMIVLVATSGGFGPLRSALREWPAAWDASRAVPVLAFGVLLAIYYTFFFGAPHFIMRYLIPLRVMIGLGVVSLFYLLWKRAASPSPLRAVLGAVVAAGIGLSAYGLLWNFTDHFPNIYMFPARWIAEHARPGEKIGMFQSGTTGFLDRNVVNLDGKVNAAALRALERGRMPAYVDSMRFAYLIDWDFFIDQALADSAVRAHYRPVDTLTGKFIVWKRAE